MSALADGLRKALTADIMNKQDGAGSDLDYAVDMEDDTFIEISGALDISALTNTAIDYIRKHG